MSLKQSVVAWVMQRKYLLSPGHRAIEWPFSLGHIPMPAEVIAAYIEQSPYHVIMDHCLCRTARDCHDYPLDIGCLFMGESALRMPPQISRRVDAAEALRHLEQAIDAGMVPLVGKVRFDNFAFLIPDEKKLLSVCFCCPCCCMMAYYRHLPPDRLDKVFPRLEGLIIEVTDACQGCGTCARNCYVKAITVENGKAVHSATCRGCGRCARFCPNQAVRIALTMPDYQKQVMRRINGSIDFK